MFPALLSAATAIGGKLYDAHNAKKAAQFNPVLKRVKDAQAAGVHPVYALGASGLDTPPAQVSFADTLGKAGQSVGDALSKSADHEGKALKALLLEKAGLENDLLRTQIAKSRVEMSTTPTQPGPETKYVIPGQGETAYANPRHKLNDPQYTPSARIMGIDFPRSGRYSDGQTYEDAYGDGPSNIPGGLSMVDDIVTQWGPRALARLRELIPSIRRVPGRRSNQEYQR